MLEGISCQGELDEGRQRSPQHLQAAPVLDCVVTEVEGS